MQRIPEMRMSQCLEMEKDRYLGEINKLLSRDGEELEVGTMSHDVTDKCLQIPRVTGSISEVSQLFFLVFQDFVGLLQPASEGRHFTSELGEFFEASHQAFEQLVGVVGNIVVAALEVLPLRLEFVKFSRAENIGSSLDEFSNDVEGIVDGAIMLVNILFDLLQR